MPCFEDPIEKLRRAPIHLQILYEHYDSSGAEHLTFQLLQAFAPVMLLMPIWRTWCIVWAV